MNHHAPPELCGCDTPDALKPLISVAEARARIRVAVAPVAARETCALACALDRILAAPVQARCALPPFDNAAMDGYAICTRTLEGDGPWDLPVRDRIAAGATGDGTADASGTVRIFTGAPVPDWADAVIMQEAVTRTGDTIRLDQCPRPGDHLRPAGEIAGMGEVLLPAGTRMGRRAIALAAAAGCATLSVKTRPRVALLITGDEVCAPGDTDRSAAGIWDVNGPMMAATLARAGLDLVAQVHCEDTLEATKAQLAALSAQADLVVTTGGISVGEEDHVRPAMHALGVQLAFSGVAIKPGKPVCFGMLDGTPWLGLPGNPVAAFITWEVFGTELCGALYGTADTAHAPRTARAAAPLSHRPGRTEYRLARITGTARSGLPEVDCPEGAAVGHVSWLALADGLICLPAACDGITKGDKVLFRPFCGPE